MESSEVKAMAVDHAERVAGLVFDDSEDLFDWLEGVLDVKRTFDRAGGLDSVELLVGFGGPNVWYTFDGRGVEVRVAWCSDPEYAYRECAVVSGEVLSMFDNWSVSV